VTHPRRSVPLSSLTVLAAQVLETELVGSGSRYEPWPRAKAWPRDYARRSNFHAEPSFSSSVTSRGQLVAYFRAAFLSRHRTGLHQIPDLRDASAPGDRTRLSRNCVSASTLPRDSASIVPNIPHVKSLGVFPAKRPIPDQIRGSARDERDPIKNLEPVPTRAERKSRLSSVYVIITERALAPFPRPFTVSGFACILRTRGG
jgi:hypothetical protein